MDYILLLQTGRPDWPTPHSRPRRPAASRLRDPREIRTVANQWAHALARQDADKWLAASGNWK